jgi:hypothetical protein
MPSLNALAQFVWSKLGYCSRCTRKAFLASLTTWLIVAVISTVTQSQTLLLMSITGAILVTIIWLSHLYAFSIRIARINNSTGEIDPERRAVLPMLARTAILAGLASAAPSLSFAQEKCGLFNCLPGQMCCAKSCPGGKTGYTCCESAAKCYNNMCIVPC